MERFVRRADTRCRTPLPAMTTKLIAFENGNIDRPTTAYAAWLLALEEDVIQGEFGYEPGEFTVYTTHWAPLYEEGLTPRAAWRRALDGFAHAREQRDAEQKENYARIVSEDQAAIARSRAAGIAALKEPDNG